MWPVAMVVCVHVMSLPCKVVGTNLLLSGHDHGICCGEEREIS